MKERVVMSWSGGKDSAMALRELLRGGDHEVVSLLTSMSEEYRRISHHGVRESLLDEQARAIGIPLRKVYLPSGIAGGCSNEVYEAIMAKEMAMYRDEGIFTVAFGDLFLEDLRAWREANWRAPACAGSFRSGNARRTGLPAKLSLLDSGPTFPAWKTGSVGRSRAGNTTKRYCATSRPTSISAVRERRI